MLTGPDVSHHQGRIDWAAVARSGVDFAWCKATEGGSYVDSQFGWNWAGMRQAGITRGAYHFLRGETDARAQARHFLATIGDPTGSLIALDVETSGDKTNPTPAQAQAFAAEIDRATGGHPLVIYTARWWWDGIAGNPSSGAKLGPLWHARYNSTPGPLYGGWSQWTFWQHSDAGRIPGINGPVDANRFLGERGDLLALTRAEQEHDMPLTPDDIAAIGTEVTRRLNAGTAVGQSDWAGTSRATLANLQTLVNTVNAASATQTKILAAVTAGLTDTQVTTLAERVAAEVARRGLTVDPGPVLNALRDRLAA